MKQTIDLDNERSVGVNDAWKDTETGAQNSIVLAPDVAPSPPTLESHPVQVPPAPPQTARIVAIGSGKGGVGKSFIAGSLGIDLALRGHRVVVIDVDLGGANLHTALGLPPAKVTLADVIVREVQHIEDVRIQTGIPNLSFVPGAHDHLTAANLGYQQKRRLLNQITSLDADFVVLDLGAGLSLNVIDFFLLGSPGILVVAPDAGSIQTAYRFLKSSFYRYYWMEARSGGARKLILEAMYEKNARGMRTRADLLKAISQIDDELRIRLESAEAFHPWLVVNQVRSVEDKRLGPTLAGFCFKHLGIDMECLHPIYHDDRVWQSNRDHMPYVLAEPAAPAAKNLDRIAGRLLV